MSLTISPVLAGRLPTEPVAGITREGTVEVGAGVDAAVAMAVAAGESAAVGRGVDGDGHEVAVAVGSDADGTGLVTVGSDTDGNGVATGSEAEGSGRIVAIGTDGRGASVGSSGRLGPTAAADLPSATNAPIATSTAKTTAAAPRPIP
jgi:hypothetical protein